MWVILAGWVRGSVFFGRARARISDSSGRLLSTSCSRSKSPGFPISSQQKSCFCGMMAFGDLLRVGGLYKLHYTTEGKVANFFSCVGVNFRNDSASPTLTPRKSLSPGVKTFSSCLYLHHLQPLPHNANGSSGKSLCGCSGFRRPFGQCQQVKVRRARGATALWDLRRRRDPICT